MPRFFFDTRVFGAVLLDDEGMEFDSLAAAHKAAAHALSELAWDAKDDMQKGVLMVTVRDEADRPTFRASMTVDLEDLSRDR